jgi:hypothetical protein
MNRKSALPKWLKNGASSVLVMVCVYFGGVGVLEDGMVLHRSFHKPAANKVQSEKCHHASSLLQCPNHSSFLVVWKV